jgi:hypothetical protein
VRLGEGIWTDKKWIEIGQKNAGVFWEIAPGFLSSEVGE